MNYRTVIVRLYLLLIRSDGEVDDSELSMGQKMIRVEGITSGEFNAQFKWMQGQDPQIVYKLCLGDVRRLEVEDQLRCIAWLCIMANADGFMDRKEWQFIYGLYHKELNLPLSKVMELQKELLRKVTQMQAADWMPQSGQQ